LQEAEAEFRRCLTETPLDKLLLAEWGNMLLSAGKTDEATAVFEQLLAADPGNADARAAIGEIHLMNGHAGDAVAILQPLYEERPFDTKVEYSLASALQAAGNREQASEIFERVSAAESRLRRKQQLVDELEQRTDLVEQVDLRFEIAGIAMNHESPEEGVRWLMSVIDLDPGYSAAYAALADYYRKIGNVELEQKYRMLAKPAANAPETP
jgi:tetratricopeptide (TPR) repeat protein